MEGALWLLRWSGARKEILGLRDKVDRLDRKVDFLISPLNTAFPIHGHLMFLDPTDGLGLTSRETFEPFQTRLMLDRIRPGDVVVDGGAHIGYYTLLFARAVGEKGHVHAVEPSPLNLEVLRKNLLFNGYKNVTVAPRGLWSQPGEQELQMTPQSWAGNGMFGRGISFDARPVMVPVVPLDHVIAPGTVVSLVKMDIQGAEGHALKGMGRVLDESPRITLVLEFWTGGLEATGTDPRELLSALTGKGFTIREIDELNQRLLPVTAGELLDRYPATGLSFTNLLCERAA